jgi:histidinol phosphatase-like PHP family hydrolase
MKGINSTITIDKLTSYYNQGTECYAIRANFKIQGYPHLVIKYFGPTKEIKTEQDALESVFKDIREEQKKVERPATIGTCEFCKTENVEVEDRPDLNFSLACVKCFKKKRPVVII